MTKHRRLTFITYIQSGSRQDDVYELVGSDFQNMVNDKGGLQKYMCSVLPLYKREGEKNAYMFINQNLMYLVAYTEWQCRGDMETVEVGVTIL